MAMNRLSRATAIVLLASVVFAGCSVREELVIDATGSGEAEIRVNIHPIMASYFNDLLVAITGVEGEYPIFDVEQIVASFEDRQGVVLEEVESPNRTSLRLRVSFTHINEVFASEGGEDILTLASSGDRRELTVRLDRAAVDRFLEFAPPESAMITEFLFPPADGSVSADEYRDEMAWALEEYGSRQDVDEALSNASIEVTVRPKGRIISQTGGRQVGQAVVFSVPILEVLTLQREMTYSLVFSP